MQRFFLIAVALIVALGASHWWRHRPLVPSAGMLVTDAPEQIDLDDGASLQRGDVMLHTRAHFAVTARVLSREDYHMDAGASLAPVDLALGWGRMSDSDVLKDITISQENRFYHWHVEHFPIPRREIETSSANMHMIPADNAVRRELDRVRTGEVIHLEGFLVDASRPDGWHWRTSMTREDTGNGACELVYVESVAPATP
ncbi:hypothetical protein P5Y53_05175 [Dyella jiangningensis]|uniref:hypothetical protein n=1 Tax=Dyella jiangningensis TaxID=1379159 RepID=UPI002410A0F4|nr:hypothetical protein [Dyella jiangningensis]MDG2537048.1 hypothetical protein [Dyella jiangningensis]